MSAPVGSVADVAIVRLGPGEAGGLRALNALFADAFADRETYLAAPPDEAWLEAILAKEGVAVFVALDGNQLLGGLVAYEFDKIERARREIYVYDLAVRVERRRRGIATALLAALREHAALRGAWVVIIQADHGDDPAVALYTKLGRREDVMTFDIPVPDPSPPRP